MTDHGSEKACRKRNAPIAAAYERAHFVEVIVGQLERRYGSVVPTAALVAIAEAAVDAYADATVANFMPILATRLATEMARDQFGNPPTLTPAN